MLHCRHSWIDFGIQLCQTLEYSFFIFLNGSFPIVRLCIICHITLLDWFLFAVFVSFIKLQCFCTLFRGVLKIKVMFTFKWNKCILFQISQCCLHEGSEQSQGCSMSGVAFFLSFFPRFFAHSMFVCSNSKFSSMTAITNFIPFPISHPLSIIFVSLRSFCCRHCRIFFFVQQYSGTVTL